MKNEISDYTEEIGDEVLREEVKTFDQYFTGQVFGYLIIDEDKDDEVVESCWGFYDNYNCEYILSEAKHLAIILQKEKDKLELETALAEVWP